MQELKPVAWMCDANDGANADATTSERVRDDYARFGRTITPLYAIPDTHRIVSVKLLEDAMVVFRVEGFDKEAEQLRAIIDKGQ
jgi:hypothetical protein